MERTYGDLLIRIQAWDQARQFYPTEAEHDGGSVFKDGLRLNQEALHQVEQDAEAYGLALFDALFTGAVRSAYDRAIGRAEVSTEGRLRIRLAIGEGAGELRALRWERLHRRQGTQAVALAMSATTPFSRYTDVEFPKPQPVSERPLRLLVAIANPTNLESYRLAPVDVAAEVQTLVKALGDLRRTNVADVILMPGRTGLPAELRGLLVDESYQIHAGATSLDQILRRLPGPHLLHVIGHGTFSRQSDAHARREAALLLEQEDGTVQIVKERELSARLSAVGTLPHLVFLAACDSANLAGEHPFVGLAPRLVQSGVPAVVAMQDKVPMVAARQLAGDFYRSLVDHGEIDRALNQARLLLYDQRVPDWSIPVLYTRLKQALFDVSRQPATTDLAKAVRTGINPFEFGNPVAPEGFVGRARQISAVKNRIGARTAQSISIVGHRRSGKSSLLQYIAERTSEFSPAEQQPVIVSLDLQDSCFHTPAGIIEGIRRGIARSMGVEPWTAAQAQDHEAVETGLRAIRSRARLILLFDEFESIGRRLEQFQGWGEDFRSKASTKGLFTLVIASKRPIDQVYKSLQLTSPFGNIFTMTIMGALEAEVWRTLIQRRFAESSAELRPGALDLIDELAGGLPFYTQMAASIIWESDDPDDHKAAREEFVFQATPNFSILWEDLNPQERHAMRHAAGLPGLVAPPRAVTAVLQRHGILRTDGRLFSSAFVDFVRGQP
jgi:hypothetical protein